MWGERSKRQAGAALGLAIVAWVAFWLRLFTSGGELLRCVDDWPRVAARPGGKVRRFWAMGSR